MHTIFRACVLVLALSLAAPALAADAQPGKPTADKPAKGSERSTVITVVHEGPDSIGARLSTRLKETLNASNLFQLNEKDMPKLRLLLSTVSEFPERPGVGSVYSVTWVFSQSENNLGYLLARDLGTVSADEVDALTNKLVERTDGLSVKYRYLFQ